MRGLWKITGFAVMFTILVLFVVFTVGLSSNQPGSAFNKGHNAIWVEHDWAGEYKSPKDIQEFVEVLEKYKIDTVFVHVGPLKTDGSIDPETYSYSINFLERARKFNDKIEYQAWIGQIRSKIDLSNESVRHNIEKQVLILSGLVGFDGIHFDIEPVWDGDLDFIETLKGSREALPKGKKISVALAEYVPESFVWLTQHLHTFENVNTDINYLNVAQYADQIVVMVYDTSIQHEWLYRWLVKEQTIWLSGLLKDKELFIGLPAYDGTNVKTFNPDVENVKNGLKGVVAGLNNIRSHEENFAGIAIYPYWEMDRDEWQALEDYWIK